MLYTVLTPYCAACAALSLHLHLPQLPETRQLTGRVLLLLVIRKLANNCLLLGVTTHLGMKTLQTTAFAITFKYVQGDLAQSY